MIRFSDIPADSILGIVSRKCLAFIPKGWSVPVLQGPLKGMHWIIGSQNHGMWLGSYEADKQSVIFQMLKDGQTFFDIGANAGFFSLLGSRCVGASGRVVAVEPLARNIEIMERNLRKNRISNVHVVKKAVSDFIGMARFSVEGHSTSRLSTNGTISVDVTTLDALVQDYGAPDLVKVDIEGAEIEFMRGAKRVLEKIRPVILMALHSQGLFEELMELTPGIEYQVKTFDGTDVVPSVFRNEVVLYPSEFNCCSTRHATSVICSG